MGFTIRYTGFRKLIFAPTTAGFKKWCIEVRKSRSYLRCFSLLPDLGKERNSSEFAEREKLLKSLEGLEASLTRVESEALRECLLGKSLNLRKPGMHGMFSLWSEQQLFLIAKLRKNNGPAITEELLKTLRESTRITKTVISQIIGVSINTYSSYEKGQKSILVEKLLTFLRFYGVGVLLS